MSVGVVDFSKTSHDVLELTRDSSLKDCRNLIFDLASLTKPLTLGAFCLKFPEEVDENLLALIEHRAGLPAWGRLSQDNWREHLREFEPRAGAETLYSDYSALYAMLEIEERGHSLEGLCQELYGDKIVFWKKLEQKDCSPITGDRHGRPIQGVVHDDNAFTIGEFCAHAGLFASADGLARALLKLDQDFELLKKVSEQIEKINTEQRFCWGWDRVTDQEKTLAGNGAGKKTFGHLGFTGTSVWIDPDKKLGTIILSNMTKSSWFYRQDLNHMRRKIGEALWAIRP